TVGLPPLDLSRRAAQRAKFAANGPVRAAAGGHLCRNRGAISSARYHARAAGGVVRAPPTSFPRATHFRLNYSPRSETRERDSRVRPVEGAAGRPAVRGRYRVQPRVAQAGRVVARARREVRALLVVLAARNVRRRPEGERSNRAA